MSAAASTGLFRRTYGSDPVGVWSAPGRVNLIGEHVDYNAGLVLPMAIPRRTWAAAAPRADGVLRIHSATVGDTVQVEVAGISPTVPGGWAAYVAGVLWALRENGNDVGGLDIVIYSDVPTGAGLSSSAALECAVAAAVGDLMGLGLLDSPSGRAELAAACVRAENEIALAPTGGMDQAASMLGRAGHALLLDCRDGSTEQVPLSLTASGVEQVILVTDTRAHHALVDGQYAMRRSACERAAALLGVGSLREIPLGELADALDRLPDDELRRRTRHVVTEIDRVVACVGALRSGDLAEVGRLFDASHASLRDDFEVSCAELDVSVEAARSAGALGARMTGGGFGGSSIALVPVVAVGAVQAAIAAAFAAQGWAAPASFTVTPADGARRDL
ncbi:MAG: galactokinase [Phycicoccus sp.]|mgnify:CR=1 FL=1|nr:galactokinase [Phycicoccus sp.]